VSTIREQGQSAYPHAAKSVEPPFENQAWGIGWGPADGLTADVFEAQLACQSRNFGLTASCTDNPACTVSIDPAALSVGCKELPPDSCPPQLTLEIRDAAGESVDGV
jgi:hypothetical protein